VRFLRQQRADCSGEQDVASGPICSSSVYEVLLSAENPMLLKISTLLAFCRLADVVREGIQQEQSHPIASTSKFHIEHSV
jgi:hypothetical protein